MQLLLQFFANRFEISQMIRSGSENWHTVFTKISDFLTFFYFVNLFSFYLKPLKSVGVW